MPGGTERGLLNAIREEPNDDTPRLVYADWIDDNGDPDSAEFIRLQVRLATMPASSSERAEARRREQALIDQAKARSLAEAKGLAKLEVLAVTREYLDPEAKTILGRRFGEGLRINEKNPHEDGWEPCF